MEATELGCPENDYVCQCQSVSFDSEKYDCLYYGLCDDPAVAKAVDQYASGGFCSTSAVA